MTDSPRHLAQSGRISVLHVAGSRVSGFHHDLSLLYARAAPLLPGMSHQFAVQTLDDRWRIGPSLSSLSPPVSLTTLIDNLADVDVMVPYQFCPPGMTSYRAFFEDVLNIPVVGSPSAVTSLATDKATTRTIVEAAGVRVAPGHVIETGDELPDAAQLTAASLRMHDGLIVKPTAEDNSVGISLIYEHSDLEAAVAEARLHGKRVLLEQFIPGREIRAAVVDPGDGTALYSPAMIEYTTSREAPVRTTTHKLKLSDDGRPTAQEHTSEVSAICPAQVDEALARDIRHQATLAHRALGCRDFSLFDFRVHEATGKPYLLEAGLFWTFGAISVLSTMVVGAGDALNPTVESVWRRAAARKGTRRKPHRTERPTASA